MLNLLMTKTSGMSYVRSTNKAWWGNFFATKEEIYWQSLGFTCVCLCGARAWVWVRAGRRKSSATHLPPWERKKEKKITHVLGSFQSVGRKKEEGCCVPSFLPFPYDRHTKPDTFCNHSPLPKALLRVGLTFETNLGRVLSQRIFGLKESLLLE